MRVNLNLCESCLEKQRTIDRQQQEIESLRKKVRRLERKAAAGPFGSSTPSAKIPVKANTAKARRGKPGGAQPGHTGHGRQAVEESDAEHIETIPVEPVCPHCGRELEHKEYRDRSVIDSLPLRAQRILYQLERACCPCCGKTVQACAPGVLPKSLYGNQLITQVVFLHYRQGIPIGRLCDQLGVGLGAVFDILHRMAALFRGVIPQLIEEYRQAPVRHADETGWRTDGRSGYAWLFASATVSLFLFRATRSAQVPKEVLGDRSAGRRAGGGPLQRLQSIPLRAAILLRASDAERGRLGQGVSRRGRGDDLHLHSDPAAGRGHAPAREVAHRHQVLRASAPASATDRGAGGANPRNTWVSGNCRTSSGTRPIVCTTG